MIIVNIKYSTNNIIIFNDDLVNALLDNVYDGGMFTPKINGLRTVNFFKGRPII